MFGHQDEEQAEHSSAATAQPTSNDHSNDNQQQADDMNNDDYLNSLSSSPEEQEHDHPDDDYQPAQVASDNQDDNNDNDNNGVGDTAPEPSGAPLADDKLLNIKQQALSELSPLVSHLDQSPEEKFKTTMMMIQASDDQSLIKSAYEAAKDIPNEKTRAQALLDIVNEINYFTHKK